MNLLWIQQSQAFTQLDQQTTTQIQAVIDTLWSNADLFDQAFGRRAQQTEALREASTLRLLEAISKASDLATLRHAKVFTILEGISASQQHHKNHTQELSRDIQRLGLAEVSSSIVLDEISRDTTAIKAALASADATFPASFAPMIEAAVRQAFSDQPGNQRSMPWPDARGRVDPSTRRKTVESPSALQVPHSSPVWHRTPFRGPKRQQVTMSTYPYRFGAITVTRSHTEQSERNLEDSRILDANRTTITATFSTWFLKMTISIHKGGTTPSIGSPYTDMSFRVYYIVDGYKSPIVLAIRNADYKTFRHLLEEREATPFDRIRQEYPAQPDRTLSLFSELYSSFLSSNNLRDRSTMLRMLQLIIDAGADCGQDTCPIGHRNVKANDASDLARLIFKHAQSDPLPGILGAVFFETTIDSSTTILQQEEWDLTDTKDIYEGWHGEGSWHHFNLMRNTDVQTWSVQQGVAWKESHAHEQFSRESFLQYYGYPFVYEGYWLQVLWEELEPCARRSWKICHEVLGEKLCKSHWVLFCRREDWKKQTQQTKLSKDASRRMFGVRFVQYFESPWRRCLIEEGLLARVPELESTDTYEGSRLDDDNLCLYNDAFDETHSMMKMKKKKTGNTIRTVKIHSRKKTTETSTTQPTRTTQTATTPILVPLELERPSSSSVQHS